jgi:predicted metal-dependent peptidase
MNHLQKITKAKAKLMLNQPYFGTIVSTLNIEQSDDIEAFVSDGIDLKYNDDYFNQLSMDDIEFSLVNGAMHSVLQHQERGTNKQKWLWQLSTDYAINSMLVSNGLLLPSKSNFQNRFKGMYAEEIYDVLRREISDEELVDDENIDISSDDPKEKNQREKNKDNTEKQEQKEQFEQIFQKFSDNEFMPKDLEVILPQYFETKVDWKELLYRYISSFAKSSYTFFPPNKKYLYQGIYLPSLSSDLLKIVISIDSSGSIDDNLLSTFISEVTNILSIYPNYEIDLIVADDKIQSHQTFFAQDEIKYNIKGRGGTDFRVVFDYIDKHIDYPTLLLYFTDAQGTFPTNQPSYDTLWILPTPKETPFGESVVIG